MKIRNVPLHKIFDRCNAEDKATIRYVYALSIRQLGEKGESLDINLRSFFYEDLKEFNMRHGYDTKGYSEDGNYVTFQEYFFREIFDHIFSKHRLTPNFYGWTLLFDHLSQNGTLYDFKHDGFNYIMTCKEDAKTLIQIIDKAVCNPDFVDATLAQIPIQLREKYFPSSSICEALAHVEINIEELNTPSEFFKILRVMEGNKTRYNIILQVEDLFGIYYTLFEQYGTIANGYGWESLIIQEFLPQKIDDDLDTIEPILDPEAAGFTISFRKKKDCLALAEELCIFLQEKERVAQAMERLVNGGDIVS